MKSKKGTPLILTGLLLTAAALFLTIFNLYEEQRAAELSRHVLLELPAKMRTPFPEKTDSEPVIPDYILNPRMDMPAVEVDGHEYIGVLTIPDLDLELPVMSRWSYPGLKISPCRYTGSAYLDNLVIAAHNYTRHFGRLKELSGGETVIFTDADGNIFTYKAALVETLMPTDIEEMENGDWDLTLFTCTVGGSYRVTVRCDRAEEPAGTPA